MNFLQSWKTSLWDATDYRAPMRRVGILAIIVGVLDTIALILAIVHRKGYSSDLGIFAIIAGVAVIRGNLNTCLKVVQWIGFAGGAILGLVIIAGTVLVARPDTSAVFLHSGLNAGQIFGFAAWTVLVLHRVGLGLPHAHIAGDARRDAVHGCGLRLVPKPAIHEHSWGRGIYRGYNDPQRVAMVKRSQPLI